MKKSAQDIPISGNVDFISHSWIGADLAVSSTILKWAMNTVPYMTIMPFRTYPKTAVFRDAKSAVTTTASINGNRKARKWVLSNTGCDGPCAMTIKLWIL